MICKKCGAEVADELTFCTVCGEELLREETKRNFLEKKKLFAAIGGGLAAVLLIVLVIVIFSGNAAEERVEDIYASVTEYDLNALLEALPPQVLSYYKDQLALEEGELEILESKELKESRVKELDERYSKAYGTQAGYIEAVSEVELTLSYQGKDVSRDPIKVYVVKVDGNWYLDLLLTAEELDEAEIDTSRLPALGKNAG